MPRTHSEKFFLCFSLIVLVLSMHTVHAQTRNIMFEHISRAEGLSQSEVICMMRDRTGFLWIGTQGGLNRYDGYTFTVYKNTVEDTNSLHDNYIQALCEDRDGMLWVGTRGALHRFDRSRRIFTRFSHDSSNTHSISDDIINAIYEDSAGTLWIGTNRGLNRFDPLTGGFIRYLNSAPDAVTAGDMRISALFTDREGTLWIGTGNGLAYVDRQRGSFIHLRNDRENPHSLSNNSVHAIYESSDGALWIGTSGGLNRLDRSTFRFTPFRHDPANPESISDDYVTAISEDATGTLWVGTNIGFNRFDPQTGGFTKYFHDPLNPHSLSFNTVGAIECEPSGTVWIGTWGGGLNKVNRNKDQFGQIVRDARNPESLSNNTIWSITEDGKGFLWIGTDDGLNRLDRRTGRIIHYNTRPGNPNSLSHRIVYSILATRSGELWVGTQKGLNLFRPESGTCTRFYRNAEDSTALAGDYISCLFEDHLGTLWIGTSEGYLHQYDRMRKRFRRITVSTSSVAYILEDHAGTLWICTWRTGLFRFDRSTETFTHYLHDPGNPASLSHNTVYAIQETFEEGKPVLWVGTRSGFNRFDPATGEFKRYYEKDGLSGDLIYGVLADNASDLWLSTQDGLTRFNPRTSVCTTFDQADGAQTEFQNDAIYKSRSGELFFGGMNGVTFFRPGDIKENPFIPPVVVTAFKVFEQFLPGLFSVSDGDSVRLTYNQNFFSVEFAALYFANPAKCRYLYKLEGFDNEWLNPGTRRYVSYTNVPPGEYMFRVKAKSPNGIWNEKGTSLRLFISPPWWKTWWAYAVYVIVALSAIFTLRRYEMNRLRLKSALEWETVEAEKLKELDRMKSQFFANISHEFRTPLTLILGQVDSVMSSDIEVGAKGKLQVALRNARRLLALINQLLDLAKIEAGSMQARAEPHNLVSFLKSVVYSFESLAEKQGISLEFRSDEATVVVLFEQDKMEKVFYNLLSNALKFTPEGGEVRVEVSVERIGESEKRRIGESAQDHIVQVTVRDTGIGIPSDQLARIFDRFYQVDNSHTREHGGTGIGLALTRELVELHGGSISVARAQGTGTEFIVRLPVDANAQRIELPADSSRVIPVDDMPLENEQELPERQSTGSRKGDIILLVEDNADVRAYIREQLENAYRIIEAPNGEQGIVKARENIPDLIITDLMMPKMDGYQFTRNIRRDHRTSHIPIVMLTAKAGLDDRIEGLEKGVDVYLTKPFSGKELNVQVRNLIARREELRRRFSTATAIKPSEVAATSIDKEFLQTIVGKIEAHFEDEHFGVEQLAAEANMSVSQLNRKLNALIAQPAGELIRSMRIQRAADLLRQNAGTVAEISYKLGFTDQAYFSRAFKKQFGCTPSEYKKR